MLPDPVKESLTFDMSFTRVRVAHRAKEANPTVQSSLMTALNLRRPLFCCVRGRPSLCMKEAGLTSHGKLESPNR
jgi:hypothetical protein